MKIEALILGTLDSSNEIRQEAENTIEELRSTNLPYFLNKLLKLLIKTENPNSIYIALNLILRETEENTVFDETLFEEFYSNFQTSLNALFLANKLNEAICYVISKILAKISFKIPTSNVELFLLNSYEQFPPLRFLFLNTLRLIFYRQPSNSPFETFIAIFSNEPSTPEEFNSLFSLLLILVIKFKTNAPNITEILIAYLKSAPNESIPFILNSISMFFKPLKNFFREFCYSEIFEFIMSSLTSFPDDFSIQSRAVDCLGSICMAFDNDPEILNQILEILMQIIDENDSDLQLICTECVCNISNSSSFLNSFMNIQKEHNYQISFFHILSSLENQCSNFQMMEYCTTFFEQIHFILTNITETDPNRLLKIRMDGFNAIQNLCVILGPIFQEDNFLALFDFLSKSLYSELNTQLIIVILSCLSSLFDKIEINELNEQFVEFFSFLINLFVQSQNVLIMLSVIDVIHNITKSISGLFVHFYPSLITMMNEVIISPDNSPLFVPILSLAEVCVSAIEKIEMEVNKSDLVALFQLAFQLRSHVESEMDLELISQAINTFIRFFAHDISSILQTQIVPAFITHLDIDIEITHLPEDHGIEEIPGFRSVSPVDFAKESTIREISYALEAIEISLSILKNEFAPFVEATLTIISKWISFPLYIQELKKESWKILNLIIQTFGEFNVNFVFDLFLLNAPNDQDLVYENVLNALKIGVERENIKIEYIPKILDVIKNKLDEDEIDFENEKKIFVFCMKNFPEITCSFFQSVFGPGLHEFLSNPCLLDFSIKVTTQYILISRDLSFFDDFGAVLLQYISDIDQVATHAALKSIGKLFGMPNTVPNYIQFSDEIIMQFYEKIIELLNNDVSFENDLEILYNQAICVFTKILWFHWDSLGETLNDSLVLLFSLLPNIFDLPQSAIAFDFVAILLKEKTQNTLEVIGLPKIIKVLLDSMEKTKAVSEANKLLFKAFIQQSISANGMPFENPTEDLSPNEYEQLQSILQE